MRSFPLFVFIAAVLSGCAATTSVSDEVTPRTLSDAKLGVGVFYMALTSQDACLRMQVTLAQRQDDAFKEMRQVVLAKGKYDKHMIAQVELEAGEYHIVRWECFHIRERIVLGKDEHGISFGGRRYKKSLARFTIGRGEIVNLGAIYLVYVAPGVVHLAGGDLPTKEMDGFRQVHPKLSAQMISRPFEVAEPVIPPAQRLAYCRRMKELHSTWNLPVPKSCTAPIAPSPLVQTSPGKPPIPR